jgi:hypothetical protein
MTAGFKFQVSGFKLKNSKNLSPETLNLKLETYFEG